MVRPLAVRFPVIDEPGFLSCRTNEQDKPLEKGVVHFQPFLLSRNFLNEDFGDFRLHGKIVSFEKCEFLALRNPSDLRKSLRE
jgi:hypothetical protein